MNGPLWFSNLLFWSGQVTLVAVAAALLSRLFQLRQPRVLLAYWRALLVVSLALPFLQPWHQSPSIATIVVAPNIDVTHVISTLGSSNNHAYLPRLTVVAQVSGVAILCGILVRLVLLALGLVKLRQLRRVSSPISSFSQSAAVLEAMRVCMNVRAEFRLSADVDSPVTFGFAAPVILLPKQFTSMEQQFQEAIACHELLHIRRLDWAQHLGEEIVRCAFWFHPAVTWLISRVRLAREAVVDGEVVALTKARKPYLEALLQFAAGRAYLTTIPAPPFLVERQLAERVALMLKEVRMSRTRLIASLTATACCLVLAATLAVWTFPLKATPRNAQNEPQGGVTGGISGGVGGGVSGGVAANSPTADGIKGGVFGGVSYPRSADVPDVDRSTLWVDSVKKGPMVRQVRGLGTLVRAEDSANVVARIALPDGMTRDVRSNQNALVDTRKALIKGHVSDIGSLSSSGTRVVDIALDAALPEGVGVNTPISGTIDIEKLQDVLYVGRPVHGMPNTTISVFKIAADGKEAARINVRFGRASVQNIEVLEGLKAGDAIILSDMSNWDKVDRIHFK